MIATEKASIEKPQKQNQNIWVCSSMDIVFFACDKHRPIMISFDAPSAAFTFIGTVLSASHHSGTRTNLTPCLALDECSKFDPLFDT